MESVGAGSKQSKKEKIIPCFEVKSLFIQAVQLHHSVPTARQVIMKQHYRIQTLLTKHSEDASDDN